METRNKSGLLYGKCKQSMDKKAWKNEMNKEGTKLKSEAEKY